MSRIDKTGRRELMTSPAYVVVAMLLVNWWLPAPAFGQATGGNVGGVVADETGGRLPGVTVTVRNTANGAVQTFVTGSEGAYRAANRQPGPYEITAELSGFATLKKAITITVGADVTVDFKMGVAGVQESLTVVGATPLVEVTKSQPSSVVTVQQMESIPVLSRSFLEMAQILPGSSPDNSKAQAFVVTKFGGAADQRNAFTTIFDGGAIDDSIWGSTLMNVTQEGVQEFRVFRNQFDAQYGSALQTVVSVLTKSGTNKFAGTGFYYGRDRALAARDYFLATTSTKPLFSQNRVGGSFGGPIAQNKTHFFGATEYNKVDRVKIIALPPSNPLAATENGQFPSSVKDRMLSAKMDHRFNDAHSFFVRYLYDNQYLAREFQVTSDSNNQDEYNRVHSVVAEESWIVSPTIVNTFRVHYLHENLGLTPYSQAPAVVRPSGTTGTASSSNQFFPRTHVTLSEAMYLSTPKHAVKIGGDLVRQNEHYDGFFNSQGTFSFGTDTPFDINTPATYPISFGIQQPGHYAYYSTLMGLYAQDDWHMFDRVHVNLGVRYDLDTNFRHNAFFEGLLTNPAYAGINRFISANRGMDWSNIQPRMGLTWDLHGDGSVVVRGGLGRYVTRNRPWIDETAQATAETATVVIEDPNRLKFFPDVNAVLGGQSIASLIATGGASRAVFLLPDQWQIPYAVTTTGGVGWQMNPKASLTVDYIHFYSPNQLGSTDRNLPASGPISASNPRPEAKFTRVQVIENFSKSWYDAVETEFQQRVGAQNSLRVSYTLSRNYRDGVNFYSAMRGTQRTPNEKGYNENDARHNVTMSGVAWLPGQVQLSGVAKFISGSPYNVQAGFDMDGDQSIPNDRPVGLETSVGRNNLDSSLTIINALRASRGLAPVDASLLKLHPYISVDMRLAKRVPLSGRRGLELYLEGYNLTNHVNFQSFTVNNNITSSSFLVQNTARPPRQAQWGARFAF